MQDVVAEVATTSGGDGNCIKVNKNDLTPSWELKKAKDNIAHILGVMLTIGFLLSHFITLIFLMCASFEEVVNYCSNFSSVWATVLGFILGYYFSKKE